MMKYKKYLGLISAFIIAVFILVVYVSDGYGNASSKADGEVNIKINVRKSLGEMPKTFRAGLMGLWAGENSKPLITASEELRLKPYLRTWINMGIDFTGGDALQEPDDFDKNFTEQVKKIDANLKQYQDRGFQLIISIEGMPKWLSKYPSDECMPSTDGCFIRWVFSPPKNYERWKSLIKSLVSTQMRDDILADYIVWDEPDWMFYGTKEQYFELYKHTVTTIKETGAAYGRTVKVGGPGMSGFDMRKESNCPIEDGFQPNKDNKEINCPKAEYAMMEEFVNYVGKNKLPLDFIDWHFADEYVIKNQTKTVRQWLKRANLPENTPLSIGEWVYDNLGEMDSTEKGAANVILKLKAFAGAGVFRHTATSVYDQCGWASGWWQNVGYFDAECPDDTRIGVIKAKWNSFKAIDKFAAESSLIDTEIEGNKDDLVVALASRTQDEQTTKILVSNFIPAKEIILQTFKSCMLSKNYAEDKLKQIHNALQQTTKVNPSKNGATFEYIRHIIQLADFPDPFNDRKVKQDLNACLPKVEEKAKEIQHYQNNPRKVKVSLANLEPGNYNLKTYVIDKDHSNPCGYNKKTEPTSTNAECGINGAIDQKVKTAKQEAQQKGAQAAFVYLKSNGYTEKDTGLITEIVKTCERQMQCVAQALDQHYRRLDRCGNNVCHSSEIVKSELKEAIKVFRETTEGLFYDSIDRINNLPEVALGGSVNTRQINVRAGWNTQTFELQPYSVMLIEVNRTEANRAEININASQDSAPVKLLTGFVHGIIYDPTKNYTQTIKLISALKPASWRLANYDNNVYQFVVGKANFPLNQGTKIIFVVQDAFNIKYGKYGKAGEPLNKLNPNCPAADTSCFQTFDGLKKTWAAFINEFMQTIVAASPVIDVYDIFSEPDWTWGGLSREQLMELFKIAHDVIRRYRPDAKISAPSASFYNKEMLEAFLDYVVANDLRLDALAWHEFDDPPTNPETVAEHAVQMRSAFSARPKLCNPNCPEMHINEYLGIQHHLVPGWNVGWLYYLEKAGVNQSSRACWDVKNQRFPFKEWSTCWAGFNGMLLEDNITPQHIYWVYKAYADGVGKRLAAESTASRIVALASKNDEAQEIKILTGRYDGNSGRVAINVTGYPAKTSEVTVKIQQVPANGNIPLALAAPISLPNQVLTVKQGSFSISLDNFQNGEAYIITIPF